MEEVVEETPGQVFERGGSVKLWKLPLEAFKLGRRLVVTEAYYFGALCEVAGRIVEVNFLEKGVHLGMVATGTKDEEILKHVTSWRRSESKVMFARRSVWGSLMLPVWSIWSRAIWSSPARKGL